MARNLPMVARQPRILHKFYIYDPNASDTLGGLRILEDTDDKGEPSGKGKYVLAVPQQIQYWVDQGLLGDKPVGELSEAGKKILAQITRGRSEDNDADPPRLPRYDRSVQSGAPSFAAQPAEQRRRKKKVAKKDAKKKPGKAEPSHAQRATYIAPGPGE